MPITARAVEGRQPSLRSNRGGDKIFSQSAAGAGVQPFPEFRKRGEKQIYFAPHVVASLDVRPRIEQDPRALRLVIETRDVQRRFAVPPAGALAGAQAQQGAHAARITNPGSSVERSVAHLRHVRAQHAAHLHRRRAAKVTSGCVGRVTSQHSRRSPRLVSRVSVRIASDKRFDHILVPVARSAVQRRQRVLRERERAGPFSAREKM